MKYNLVTKANALIEASYRLTVSEQKIILLLASKVQPEDEDFKEYTFSIVDFMSLIGVKNRSKYKEVQETTKRLMQKTFEFRTGNVLTQVAWLSGAQYHEGEGRVTLVFHRWLRPFLLQLKKEFTRYRLENVIQLRSVYSVRIYELLKQYEGIKYRQFEIDILRRTLGLTENEYRLYADFKRRIIVIAQKELKQKTDISFTFEEIKGIRGKVKTIKFFIKQNKEIFNKTYLNNTYTDSAEQIINDLNLYFNKKNVLEILRKYGEDNCKNQLENLKKIKKVKSIQNPSKWIKEALERKTSNYFEADKNKLVFYSEDLKQDSSEELSPDGQILFKKLVSFKKKY